MNRILMTWATMTLLVGCSKQHDGGSGLRDTEYVLPTTQAEHYCESVDNSKPVYIRVSREIDSLYQAYSEGALNAFTFLDHMVAWIDRSNKKLLFLERLNIALVQGTPGAKEGCVLDLILGGTTGQAQDHSYSPLPSPVTVADSTIDAKVFDGGWRQLESQFQPWNHSVRFDPLPEGLYNLSPVAWFGQPYDFFARISDPKKEGLGPFYASLEPDTSHPAMKGGTRSGLEFHADVNEGTMPGTSGCLSIPPEKSLQLLCWFEKYRPTKVLADWHRGTFNSGSNRARLDVSVVAGKKAIPNGFLCDNPSLPTGAKVESGGRLWYHQKTEPQHRFERALHPSL